jgi:hypothetical protein
MTLFQKNLSPKMSALKFINRETVREIKKAKYKSGKIITKKHFFIVWISLIFCLVFPDFLLDFPIALL